MQAVVPPSDNNPNGHTAATILAAIQGSEGFRRWSFRYDLLDANGAKIGDLDNVQAGSVDQNWLGDIKRTAKFEVKEVTYINYLSDRIQPWVRLHLPPYGDNDWAEWPQGVFILSTPTRGIEASGRVHREVDGYDLTQILLDDKVINRHSVAAGAAYTAAVTALLPGTANVVVSALTLPVAMEWDPGTAKLKIINDLLSAINYESLSVDERGVFQVRPYRSPAARPPEYTYGVTDDSIMLPEVEQTLDLFSIPNQWVLVVSEPDRAAAIRGVYTNNDPASLTSTVRRGRTIVDFRTEQDAADAATLTAKAERLGFEASQVYEALAFTTGLNPLHSGNDLYRITDPRLGLNATYVEHAWSMDLAATAKMSHKARRVLSLAP